MKNKGRNTILLLTPIISRLERADVWMYVVVLLLVCSVIVHDLHVRL